MDAQHIDMSPIYHSAHQYSTDDAGKELTLRFDATLNAYFDLDELVEERVPDTVLREERQFSGTFRGMTPLIFGVILFMTVFGCPIAFILTSQNNAWWMITLKVVIAVLGIILGLGVAAGIGLQLRDAIRMRRWLYAKDLPPEPGPDPELALPGRAITYDERGAI